MKIYKTLIFITLAATLTLLTVLLQNDHTVKEEVSAGFVRLEDGVFKLDQDTFFPLMLNYIVEFRNPDGHFTVSPDKSYDYIDRYESNTKEEIAHQMRGHFQLIKEMGFNTLRICFDRVGQDESGHYYYQADEQQYYLTRDYPAIIAGLEEMLKVAEDADLRVMLLIKAPMNKELKRFTAHLLHALRNNKTIFAYDFANEPLYFDDNPKRTKQEAYHIVDSWHKMMQKHAPHQLLTIGFAEPLEVFEWDPSLLPVDFLAFHTYHPLRVPNEIYWYSTYVGKPWMLGETALPADNDSISYDDQRQFMREVYRYLRDCGGIGMGWWEYQEVSASGFEARYTALLNHEGITRTREGGYEIIGTVKPAAAEIAHFADYQPQPKWQAVNYYNMMGYQNYLIRGQVVDKVTGQPIEGAVVRGWNEYWNVGQNTFTDSLGRFTLYSNDECVHFEISACGMTKLKFNDRTIQYQPVNGYVETEELPDRQLEYHQISYHPFLNTSILDSNHRIFNFNDSLLHRCRLVGEMKPCKLSKVTLK